jgi:hypothetical protein
MKKEYRIVEGYGQYFNKRWEVQEKYSYYENGEKIEAWHTVFHSVDKDRCIEVMKRYETEPTKERIIFDANLWN